MSNQNEELKLIRMNEVEATEICGYQCSFAGSRLVIYHIIPEEMISIFPHAKNFHLVTTKVDLFSSDISISGLCPETLFIHQ